MANIEIEEEKIIRIGNKDTTFKIIAGPLIFQGEELNETYVVEIDYQDSLKEHRKQLPANGFNSQISLDYAEHANELAEEFCQANGFAINNHLNSFPEYQAVVSKSHV